jgi:hypothetical protein
MEIDIITQKDLFKFKNELLKEIQELLEGKRDQGEDREWLKSPDVRKILRISQGTLQNLRINRTLPFTKIGGSIYYRKEDIYSIMDGKRAK